MTDLPGIFLARVVHAGVCREKRRGLHRKHEHNNQDERTRSENAAYICQTIARSVVVF